MKDNGFKSFVLDQLRDMPGIECRAVTGGFGLYRDGGFFGLVSKGRMYLKVSPGTVGEFEERGMEPLEGGGNHSLRGFYEVPLEVVEDREQILSWSEKAIDSAFLSLATARSINESRAREQAP